MITSERVDFFWQHGYLHIPQVFTEEEINQMTTDLDWMIDVWAHKTPGWSGPWRKTYMDKETEKKSKLIAMHDLYFYSESWMKAVTNDSLCDAIAALLGPEVELHHSTMHVKPPETG
nr:phytanoyl-CoA dioxygenase family protein [Candidatus Poribacteria bacterium]